MGIDTGNSGSLRDELRKIQARIDAAPTPPSAILADHRVPYGRVYRQWLTDGRLIVWMNRGQLHDLCRRVAPGDRAYFGIPVYTHPAG